MADVDKEGEGADHVVPADLVEVHEAIEWMEAVKNLPDAPDAPETPEDDG